MLPLSAEYRPKQTCPEKEGTAMIRSPKGFTGRSLRLGLRGPLLAAIVVFIPVLAGCPRSNDPKYYVDRLHSSDAEVQRRAIEELLRMQKEAMPLVEEAIKSPDKNVRIGIAGFLSKVRRMDSLTEVGKLIKDPDKDVRLKAIEAVVGLSQVWKKKAVEILTIAFDGAAPDCIKKAGEGLRDMKYDEATEVLRKEFQSGQGVQGMYAAKLLYEIEPSPEIARPLLQGLLADDRMVQEAAALNVKELKDKIVPELVKFVDTGTATGRARLVLDKVRDALIEELDVTLDSERATDILHALGTIADETSIEKLNSDMLDTGLESAWRVGAAQSLARSALSSRCSEANKAKVKQYLFAALDNTDEDIRIRIGAAIALCQLRQDRAVTFLLDQLNQFEEAIKAPNLSQARRDDLTELRIGAQEALTASGDFVVPFLMERLREKAAGKKPGPIIIWAAAKTLGELKVKEAVPFLGTYLSSQKPPVITLAPNGDVAQINMGKPLDQESLAQIGFLSDKAREGTVLTAADMKDWKSLTDAQVTKARAMLDVFAYPDYVRWASAIALGRIGGADAVGLLRGGEKEEVAFLGALAKAKEQPDYFKRANVVDGLIGQHEDVLFYIRGSLESLTQKP